MRQTVKKLKNGTEITFTCSQCGTLIHDMFLPIGKQVEPNWDKIPEKCSCGARLTNRMPIIDNSEIGNSNLDIGRINEIDGNNGNSDINGGRLRDLESAISIDYFDMRLGSFKRDNIKVPDNIDQLRIECIKRNIFRVESHAKHLSCTEDKCEKVETENRLNVLKQRYNDLYKKIKYDIDVDFDKKSKKRN